jgi:hypothetical protein
MRDGENIVLELILPGIIGFFFGILVGFLMGHSKPWEDGIVVGGLSMIIFLILALLK